MARIRTIKPEFPQSESTGRLSRDARLLFIMLWTISDDVGRCRAASRMLASLLYPYDDDAPKEIGGWLEELERERCITRYVIDDTSYLQINNWLKHQKIDHPGQSKIPPPPEILAKSPETIATDLVPSTLDLGPRTESALRAPAPPPEIEAPATPQPAAPAKPAKKKKPPRIVQSTLDPSWAMGTEQLEYARRIGLSEVEAAREWKKFKGYHGAKGTKFADWHIAWQNWARKAMEFLGRPIKDDPLPVEEKIDMTDEQWKRALLIYATTNNWPLSSPPPGKPGCLVPPHLMPPDEPELL